MLCAIAGMGGAEFSLLELVKHLRDSYEFHLIIPGEGPFQRHAEAAGATVWILPWPEAIFSTGETAMHAGAGKILRAATSLRPFTRRLSSLLDEIQPVGVHHQRRQGAHHRRAGPQAAARPTNLVYARWPGGTYSVAQVAGLAFAPLRYVRLHLPLRRCAVPGVCLGIRCPSTVIYNIVDLNRFHPGVAPPADLSKGPEEVWFGLVGAITPLKGHDVFLQAAEKVLKQLPNAVFVIAGDNSYITEAGSRL